MTENKRFTKYVPDSYGYTYITTIIDSKKNKQTGNIDEIVGMLNELNDENIELHIQNDFLKDENQHMRSLVNENEQLYELIDFVNTLIVFEGSESCQMKWKKRLEELKSE